MGNNNNSNNMGNNQSTNNFTYSFHGDPRATFAEFFGTTNPFETFFNMPTAGGSASGTAGGLFSDNLDSGMDSMDDPFAFSSLGGLGFGPSATRTPFRSHSFNVGPRKEKPQDPPIEHDLYVSLEDINRGVTKRMKISRRVVANDGSVRKEEKVLTINVKPGWKSGTKITFQREGDQAPNKIPADIVFIIRDKPHPHFKREGSDLKYTCQISLKEVRPIFFFLNLPPFFSRGKKDFFLLSAADQYNLGFAFRQNFLGYFGRMNTMKGLGNNADAYFILFSS